MRKPSISLVTIILLSVYVLFNRFVESSALTAYQQQLSQQGTEYSTPARSIIPSASRRRLHQVAPSLCGKLGTYVPNPLQQAGSLYGIAISPNADGSIVGVGAPLNTLNVTDPGGAIVLTSVNSKTCEYKADKVWRPKNSYKYFGAQIAVSEDGNTMVIMDGVEAIKPPGNASAGGNRPVVHVYKRDMDPKHFKYGEFTAPFKRIQQLDCEYRAAMAAAMAVSVSADGGLIVVSFSVGEAFPDKRGSAQVFRYDSTANSYLYVQDLAMLNMPAGVSIQFGATSQISSDGLTIAVGTAALTDQLYKYTYLYRLDEATSRFRIVSAVSNGEQWSDPWTLAATMGISTDNGLALSQKGRFLLRVEDNMLVVYQGDGKGLFWTWVRRCQIAPPLGYMWRTNAGAMSIVESSPVRAKFAIGAYIGDLEINPQEMAVFLFYLNTAEKGSCPYRPAEKHRNPDPFSHYGAGVALTADGKVLMVGAPTAWDNNMERQNGAVYMIDVSSVEDDGLAAVTVTPAVNTKAGCKDGRDANGNACVDIPNFQPLCKKVTLKGGKVIQYGAPGCTPTPPPPSFWTADLGGAQPSELSGGGVAGPQFRTSRVSAYSNINPSIKGGVGVPVGQNTWLQNQVNAASQASYFGVPTTAVTNPRESVVSAAGWPASVQPALGGLPKPEGPAPPPVNVVKAVGALLSGMQGAGGVGGGIGPSLAGSSRPAGLPAGAVIRNPKVLKQGAQSVGAGGPQL